jgi:hypothetical protein
MLSYSVSIPCVHTIWCLYINHIQRSSTIIQQSIVKCLMLSYNALLLKKKVSIDRKKTRLSISFDDENYREQRCAVESQVQHTKATWLCVSLQNNCGITYLWTCMLFPNFTISLTSINQRAKPYQFFIHTSPGNQQRSEKPWKAKFYQRRSLL